MKRLHYSSISTILDKNTIVTIFGHIHKIQEDMTTLPSYVTLEKEIDSGSLTPKQLSTYRRNEATTFPKSITYKQWVTRSISPTIRTKKFKKIKL